MLSAIFMMMRWIAPVEAAYNVITLKFTDNDDGVEYDAVKKVVKASNHITGCINFNEANTAIIDKNTVTMDCSLQTFSMIDRMIDEENTTEWEEIVREFNLNMICEILRVFEYLLYDDDVRDVLHKRLVEHIFPRIVFSVTNIEQRDEYMESNKGDIKKKIADQMGLILPLYLQKYNLGIRKEEDMAVIYKDAENKNQKEVLKSIEFSELRILPGALNSVIEEEVNTDENQRLGMLLWMFDVYLGISTLDLSGYTLTDGLMGQLSAMEYLKTLDLRECFMELGNDCDWIGTGFKVLEDLDFSGVKIDENVARILSKIENLRRLNLRGCLMKLRNDCNWIGNGFRLLNDLDISGVKIEDVFAGILCRTTSLKKLSMEKCFIKPESSLEFIKEQKDLKELRIGRNYLSEEHSDIIFNHENIEVLDMNSCAVDDMYIYGGKIESTEMLKEFNGRKICIEEGEMTISLSKIRSRCCLENWKLQDERLMFFGNDGEMMINLLTDKMDETNSYALESGTKTWRLSELNGSQVFVEGNREIRIVLPQTSSIPDELKEVIRGEVYFTGKENGKMNFLDIMKSKEFMKKVEEYNCGQVYFADKQIDMILSHNGLRKLNMRQCGLESKAIMKIKDKSTLMELDLSNNNIIGENDMIHIIKECPNLRTLNMNKCRMLVTGDFKDISILEKLEELNIGRNKLNSKYIEYIFKHKKLLTLNLEGCELVEDNFQGIEDLEGLKELDISDNFMGKRDLDRIFKLKELEVLNMSKSRQFGVAYNRNVNISIIGIKALSKLKVFDMGDNRLLEASINEIFELKELRDLRIEDYSLRCGMLRNISNLINLEKLSIKDAKMDENDIEGITSLKNLKELSISRSNIYGDRAFDNIGRLNDSLRSLIIEKCYIDADECMKKLVELTNLRELRFVTIMPFEILCDILEKLTCLKVLYLGVVNAEEIISWDSFLLSLHSKLEILDLECIHVTNEFIKGLNNLVNLRELSLTCRTENKNDKTGYLDISVFPSGLQKLKVSGRINYLLDLNCKGNQATDDIFENLEELCFICIGSISNVIRSKITECTKLRKFELKIDSSSMRELDFKGMERIITLENLVLEGVYLRSEDIVRLSCLKQLRILKLCHCNLNEKYLNEIEELRSLEILDIQGNWRLYYSTNGILNLKNLRKLSVDYIRFDYDKRGDFELIKGFESFDYYIWEVYKNDKRINGESTDFDDVVAGIRKEAMLNNWKGVIGQKCLCESKNPVIYAVLFN
ncbi:hypothetical protein PAEPH01_0325 [Pancytospora epiphaga]|nr:hypothetical protein PAEPH01_0325 [Pancytospora epiphaga]